MLLSNRPVLDEDGTLDHEPDLQPRALTLLILVVGALVGLGVYGPYYWAYSPEQVCSEQTAVPFEQCLDSIAFARSAGW